MRKDPLDLLRIVLAQGRSTKRRVSSGTIADVTPGMIPTAARAIRQTRHADAEIHRARSCCVRALP